MILINLLPHRELARKRRREFFYLSLGISVLVGGLICGGVYSGYQSQIYAQQARNTHLKNAIAKLESEIKDITGLQQEILALRARQTAVEDLQGNRNLPVYLLSELVKQLPDGVYINSMRQDNQIVTLTGIAQSNERVSELLRNLANNSLWLTRPELIEITSSSINLNAREQRRVSNFSVRVALKKASDQPSVPNVVTTPAPVAQTGAAVTKP